MNGLRRNERGQVIVLFALLLPIFMGIGAIVIAIGNWYVHGKHLQTKADASALAGGGGWGFPCADDVNDRIELNARTYLGKHIEADGTPFTATTFNPQVGGVTGSQIHGVLNGTDYYDDDSNPAPADYADPSGSACDAKILDVKVTEDNSFPLFSLMPFFPDIKRKARVQIEQGDSFGGLLPIAVRVPKPTSAAAIFYDESTGNGTILDVRYMREVCWNQVPNPCIGEITAAGADLGHWTTDGSTKGDGTPSGNARFTMPEGQVGVVIALSFRPTCPDSAPGPCFDIDTSQYPTVDAMCNQQSAAVVQCYYTNNGNPPAVQSGLQFIRGYTQNGPGNTPWLRSAWLTDPDVIPPCWNGGYFNAPVSQNCPGTLHVDVDVSGATSGNYEIRYKMVAGNTSWADDDPPNACNATYGVNCDVTSGTAPVEFDRAYARHAIAIRVRLQNTSGPGIPAACNDSGYDANCQWFFLGAGNPGGPRVTNPPTNAQIFANPVQRGFMGNIDRSASIKYLQLRADEACDGGFELGFGETGPAASVRASAGAGDPRCFRVDMGLQGALAKDQDEAPIQLNLGNTSQSSVLDCDPDLSNLKDEIAQGCGPDGWPDYKAHDFAQTPFCPGWSGINNFFSLPKPSPWDKWSPFTCVATQTAASPNQVIEGLNERFFGDPNNPSCPADDRAFHTGRNYWHDENNDFVDPKWGEDYPTFARKSRNHGNLLGKLGNDPRYVLLFMTPYNSFTGNGNELYPVTLIGAFYITGYGHVLGNGSLVNEDPCADGSGAAVGAGNTPPSDLDTSTSGAVAWGHFVQPVDLGTSSGGTGVLCGTGGDTQPCVTVLVE